MASVLVLHSTETPSSSFESTKAGLIRDHYEPHWLWDPTPGINRMDRMLPDSAVGRALVHHKGDPETNGRSGGVIQAEVMGYAKDIPSYSDEWFSNFAKMVYKTCTDSGIKLYFPCRWLPYPTSYGGNSARLGWNAWATVEGIVGHMHIPGNVHGDPGDLTKLNNAVNRLVNSLMEVIPMPWSLSHLGMAMDAVEEIYLNSKRGAVPKLEERTAWAKDLQTKLDAGQDPAPTLEYIAYALSQEK